MNGGTMTERNPWLKPELIVLVRTNPEEAVLTNCKLPTINVNIKNKPQCSASACKNIAGS